MFHLSKPLNRLDLRLKNHWLLPCDLKAPMITDKKREDSRDAADSEYKEKVLIKKE